MGASKNPGMNAAAYNRATEICIVGLCVKLICEIDAIRVKSACFWNNGKCYIQRSRYIKSRSDL
jgi:hypothetical protein